MMLAFYSHRLPTNYDVGLIRSRIRERGPDWDAVPDLYFKAFLLRERGQHGARTHSYSLQYLWRHDGAFRGFLDERFMVVADDFGRPQIHTQFALDARRGSARTARFAYRQQIEIPSETDLNEAYAREIELNRKRAVQPGMLFAAVGVDTRDWKFTRVQFSENELTDKDAGTPFQILYLARPQFEALPSADTLSAGTFKP